MFTEKRLHEIIDKAGFMIEGENIYASGLFDNITDDVLDLIEFVVQECIDQVGHFEYGLDGEQSEFAMDVLRSHFGVE